MGMCVSVDPESGYRWSTRYCNGPDKATFVCQIPGKISDGSGFLGFSFRVLNVEFLGIGRASVFGFRSVSGSKKVGFLGLGTHH